MSTEIQTITCPQLAELVERDSQTEIIDVRTPGEFRGVHSKYARNVPLHSLDPDAVMQSRNDATAPLYVICLSGGRSAKACQAFVKAGFSNVINVEGGTSAWEQAGLPVNRSRKTMSLERQVRITAGFLVFIGAAAALWTNNVYFAGLPAFIGAGLMFAGITDTCGMGMLIAKMPWNHASDGG